MKKATKEIDALIIKVQKEQVVADAKKIECEAEEVECNVERDKANVLKDDCKVEVEKLEPLLIRALKNLEGVSRADIDFIKSTRTPSSALVSLFKALCILYGFREGKEVKMKKDEKNQFKKIPDYFECARKLIMNKPNVMINTLKSYKENKINEMDTNIIKKWQKMIDTEEQFNEEKLNRTSEAAGKIFNWITCIIEVYHSLLLINPKREALAKAIADLKSAEDKLAETKANLQAVIDKIMELKKELQDAQDRKAHLESEVKRCKRQVEAAEKLMDGLASEKISWKKRSEDLKVAAKTILGDTILASGIIAYLGAFPKDYREEAVGIWSKMI